MTELAYLPTLQQLGLALAIGLFIGLEREHRGKEAGLRTFGCASLLGALGAILGPSFALVSLELLALLVLLLNVHSLRMGQGLELTTSTALFVTGFAGILCGFGHTLTPAALAAVTAALLAWKEPLAGFSRALTVTELRSAIALSILALVIYPALPFGAVDRWDLIEPRAAWLTVLLVAGMGFANYVALKLYGARGIELTGFLGGLVNSTVTTTELARRDRESSGALADSTFRAIVLATGAMILRNAVLLAVLAPAALVSGAAAVALMLVGSALFVLPHRTVDAPAPTLPLSSPFALTSAIRFGLIFLALQVAGTLAQRALGEVGFYAVSLVGGMVSSASAVASAGAVAAHHQVDVGVAATGAVLATLVSAAINLPLAARVSSNRALARRLALPIAVIVALGIAGVAAQRLLGA